jgi:beta-lactamase superfamily II metal-dependent hydrolase
MPPAKRQREDDKTAEDERPRTRSRTKPDRDRVQQEEEERVAAAATELEAQRLEALRNRPPAPPGNRGDGSLHVAFMRVGQGDCAVMSTPRGQVILFDCGSDSAEGESADGFKRRVRSILTGPKFLGGSNLVDILVLTHPDSDHYNKLKAVLPAGCRISKCYHSARSNQYSQAQTSSFLSGRMPRSAIQRVTVNHDTLGRVPGAVSLNGTPVAAAGGGITVDRLDGLGGILIVDEPNCKVSILAAGVEHNYENDSSNPTNRGSIVTLVEANGARLLMCGDATVNTEQFLRNTAGARLKNLTVVQAGHHGSINTSSSQSFIDLVNPTVVVASAGKRIPMHHLPSQEVIERYVDRLTASRRTEIARHETFFYAPGGLGSYVEESLWTTQQVFTTGSRDTVELSFPAAQ